LRRCFIGRVEQKAEDMNPPIFIQIRVKPNARTSRLEEECDGTWLAQLRSPPVDGRANAELIELVAKQFDCRKASISIKSGSSGRVKLVRIETT